MFDLDRFMADRQCTLVRRIGSKERSELYLLRPACGGEFVCRVYPREVPAYQQAAQLRIRQLPKVYRCQHWDDVFLVEEEYIDGLSLAEALKVGLPDERQAAAITTEVCRGLAVLHEKGIIHRDVKPENVLLTSAGRVVLIDLDAASGYDPEKHRDTSLLGTVGYAAPEQFGFGRSDVRTDIFCLGVMLNIMLTGEHPSQRLADGVLRPVIERCIAVNADQRYSSAEELLQVILDIIGGDDVCPECGFITPGGGCLFCGTGSRERTGPTRAKRWPRLAAAALCLMIGLAAGLLISHRESTVGQPEDEPPAISQSAQPAPSEELPPEGSAPVQLHPVQTEVTLYNGNYTLSPAEFQYGGETYLLNAGLNVNGAMMAICQEQLGLREYNSPDEEYPLSNQSDRIVAPMIWKQEPSGETIPVPELAHLLEDPTVTMYRLQEEGTAPDISALEPCEGVWRGCTNFRFYSSSKGRWLAEVKATVEGTEYRAYTLIVITDQWP